MLLGWGQNLTRYYPEMYGQRWDSVSAGVLAKVFGALLLSGLSTAPGTEYQLDLALCCPMAAWSWADQEKAKGKNTQVAVFATSSWLGSALAQVLVLLPAAGKQTSTLLPPSSLHGWIRSTTGQPQPEVFDQPWTYISFNMCSSSDYFHGFVLSLNDYASVFPSDKQHWHYSNDGSFLRQQLQKEGKAASGSNFAATLKVHHECWRLNTVKTGLGMFSLLTTGIQLIILDIQFPMNGEDVFKLHTEGP